ncbi:CRISPR-associated RAMP protein, Cmr1 family [Dethiosulfovibrio peptidovorans DSM 11002]|uniref:CRISPR-associated RAMP protein, Cmr1 family n=1 Tax=Dethiosulfovibrio peptidovorans DSM 11002 TaxID=469381 RepID=D2Z4K2_9BACT|nr:type III-B CRISPR module RAMP protein Cmr1 [Dethiosulfovibrio peptidovorans]EFC90531.1 CRISPR-associated RAMP protein, Cmr1 family [Dethiosulfovibrio peptidovorans DSM 11002]
MRSIGSKPPAKPESNLGDGTFEETYRISVVTPMFGGGVKAGEVDGKHPVRGTAIRGHLRFWWRATCGRKFSSSQELYHRESQIWGDTEKASPVRISVSKHTSIETKAVDRFKNFGPEQYALFSAKQNGQEVATEGLSFDLNVSAPDYIDGYQDIKKTTPIKVSVRDEVLCALRAWLSFGGIGSRTRRGLGALHNDGTDLGEDYLSNCLSDGVFASVLISNPKGGAMAAWRDSVEVYRSFRQGFRGAIHEKVLNNGKVLHVPGRTFWPEADAIRDITGCSTPKHSEPIVPNVARRSFPRAHLGLPIIFQFVDGDKNRARSDRDPSPTTIKPSGAERMSSPIITRPIFVDGSWRSGLFLLPPPFLRALDLSGKWVSHGRSEEFKDSVETSLEDTKAMNCKPMGGKNVFDAFMAYAKSQGFQEVSR